MDEGAFPFRDLGGERNGSLQALPGFRIVGRVHLRIDVWPEHQRRAPPAHRAVGIELGCLEKRTFGGVVVEAEGQHQPLVEPALHFRVARRDLEIVCAQSGQQRRADRRLERCGL